MCKNQKDKIVKHLKIIEISTIISAFMMGIELITVAFRIDTLISTFLCCIIASMFLVVTIVELYIIEKKDNPAE